MDQSKEALLSPSHFENENENSYEQRDPAEYASDADSDADDFQQSDRLTSSKPSRGFDPQPKKRWTCKPCCCFLTGRSRQWITGCLGIFALVWLIVISSGFYVYKNHTNPIDGLSPPWYPTPR